MPSEHDLESRMQNLMERLGHSFRDAGLLGEALRHSSDPDVSQGRAASNQRLEFLGDRVLGLVIAEWLLQRYPGEAEGEIARRHANLVRRDALARAGGDIDLASYLSLSRGEDEAGGRQNPALIADACEAVIAALYLDGGLDPAAAFIAKAWAEMIAEAPEPPVDSKTHLQEWAQGRGLKLPSYAETGRQGPAHNPQFTIEAMVDGYPPMAGTGASKRAAEQEAAKALLIKLGEDPGENHG